MFQLNLLSDAKVVRVAPAAAAAQTEVVSSVVDTQGYQSVAFIALLGDVTTASVLGLTVKTNSANSTSTPTPVTTTAAASFTADATNADNKMLIVDVNEPRDRFVFASLTRTVANAAVDGIVAVLYNPNQRPVTADASVVASKFVNDPASA